MFKAIMLFTKGVIRDQAMRRKMMFWVMLAAMIMLFVGTVFISDQWMRLNPWLAIGYWAVCGWLTLTGMLLAIMDMLVIRAIHRIARRRIESEMLKKSTEEEE